MPFNLKAIPQIVTRAVEQRTLIPLLGAGVSKQAGATFPSWGELLEQMRTHAVERGHISVEESDEMSRLLTSQQFLMVAEALRSSLPQDEYEEFLEQRFAPSGIQPAPIHKAVFRLRAPLIMTTNYDLLLEDAYAAEFGQAATVYTYRDAAVVQRSLHMGRLSSRPTIFKLHGSIDEPSEIILTERDYRKLIYGSPGYRSVISALFITHVVLMLGFSLSDKELLLLLENTRESLKGRSSPDFVFLSSQSAGKVQVRRLREDYGVQVISYEESSGHPELLQLMEYLSGFAPHV